MWKAILRPQARRSRTSATVALLVPYCARKIGGPKSAQTAKSPQDKDSEFDKSDTHTLES
jgi:hypothetical protein